MELGIVLQELAENVINTFKLKGLTLAVAESATGGFLSHYITNVDGSSRVFLGSVVAYTAFSKNNLLDVNIDIISEYGAISPETTEALLQGLKAKIGADITIAITGIAGSTIVEGKPRGLMYIGFSSENKTKIEEFHFSGTRFEIKAQTVKAVFEILLRELAAL
jgi:PncC family amidohydrolase